MRGFFYVRPVRRDSGRRVFARVVRAAGAATPAPHPTLTAVGVTWLYGFQFEIKAIARLPETVDA